MAFRVTTTAFQSRSSIPVNFTDDGPNKSPFIRWENAPIETQSFALVVEDPDVPGEVFCHWLIYDIPASARQLDPELPRNEQLPAGIKQGVNDFDEIGYSGPKPPPGQRHQYVFRLLALRRSLNLPAGLRKNQFWSEVKANDILAQAEVTGFYKSLMKRKKAAS